MLDLSKDIQSLSSFKRNSLEFVERLRATGNPLVLTVNGKAEIVLQHVDAYQRLVDQSSDSAGEQKPLARKHAASK